MQIDIKLNLAAFSEETLTKLLIDGVLSQAEYIEELDRRSAAEAERLLKLAIKTH